MQSFEAMGLSMLQAAEGQRQLSAALWAAISRAARRVAERYRLAERPVIR